MSLLGECRDIHGQAVKHGLVFMAGPGECHQCTCENGVPKHCQDVMCHQPQNCSTFRKGARCCDFVCLDDISPGKTDVVSLEGDFGLRLVASVITAILSFSLLFFLVHRLRQRKIRTGRQNRQLSEDERSLGSIGYITGSLGYLPGAMERYEEPSVHFPHYPLWKPPGNYFPRGEAPPPYEEAVAATRAEALAAAMASGSLHATAANFNRDAAHLGINYNTYSAGNLLGGAAHRTIPMNLATSASFTLQPERFDEVPSGGGTSCVSVATGTVSVTATVTAPPLMRPDADPTHRSSTLRRNEIGTRSELNHRSETGHRPEVVLRSDTGHRSESSHRPEIHRPDTNHRSDANLRNDIIHRADISHQSDSTYHRVDAAQRPSHRSETHRTDLGHRLDMSHRDTINRANSRRQDTGAALAHHRVEERRLPSMPPPENSLSLPTSHHSHGAHHSVYNYNHVLSHTQPHQSHHQTPSAHSHSFGHQHQLHQLHVHAGVASTPATMPLLDIPAPLIGTDLQREERCPTAATSKIIIPPVTSIPKSGTGVYEDVLVGQPTALSTVESYNPTSYTATLRRGKHISAMNSSYNSASRRGPVSVPAPTLSPPLIPIPQPATSTSITAGSAAISSPITIPPPPIPSPEHGSENGVGANSAAVTAAVAALVAASPPKCTCLKNQNPRCTCPGSCHSSITSLTVSESAMPRDSNLSLTQAGLDDNDDYRSECENCKSTHSSNYYLDAEEPEPEITMTLHRKPTDTGEENGNAYYRTSLTLPTRHRVVPLHGTTSSGGARDNWFSSMPESSTDESEED